MDPVAELGYDNARFRGGVDPNLHCQICCNVLRDPVQCRRKGHHFCTPCITRFLKQQHSCPICLDKLTNETLAQPRRSLVNALLSLRITCDYVQRGCQEVMELNFLKTHVQNCGYAPVSCSNDGCLMFINKRDKEQHESNDCEFRKSDEESSRYVAESSESSLTSVLVGAAAVGTVAIAGSLFGLIRRRISTKGSKKESPTDSNLEDYEFPSDSDEEEVVEEFFPPSSRMLQAEAATLPPSSSPRQKFQMSQSCSNLDDYGFPSSDENDEEVPLHAQGARESLTCAPGFLSPGRTPATQTSESYTEVFSDPFIRYIAMPSDAPYMSKDFLDSVLNDEPAIRQSGSITVPFKGIVENSKAVGQDGGQLLLDDVSLTIPRRSLQEKVNIKVTLEDPMPYQSLLRDSGLKIGEVQINHIIKLEPPGVLFNPPVSIRVKIIPGGEYLFILHGTRNVDGFVEWEDVTNEVLVDKHGKYASSVTMVIKTFCRYATVRSRFNIPGRILDSLNCKFQTRSVALFKRPEAFQLCFDTRVVFMSDEVFQTAYESSQAHDLVSNEGYGKCDSGSVKKVYTNRDLDIHCQVFETDGQLKTSFPISSSRLNQIGDVFDEFSNVKKPRIVKGCFVITQTQKGVEKQLWTLRFWDEEDKVAEPSKVIEPVVTKEEQQNLLAKGSNSCILAKNNLEDLSKVICSKWGNLARLLNIDDDIVNNNLSEFPDESSKAEKILEVFNSDPKAVSGDLINALGSLKIRVPEFLLQNEASAIDMGTTSSYNADINPFGTTTHEQLNYRENAKPMTEKTPLYGIEIEMAAREISRKWSMLGNLLEIEQHELENLHQNNAHETDKAARILRLYNKMPGFSREELGKFLKELKLVDLQDQITKGKFRRRGTNGLTLRK